MAKLTAFLVGHCTHPSCMVLKGSGLATRCYPSRAYLIGTRAGLLLWDTGYAERFMSETRKGVFRLYRAVAPVTFQPEHALAHRRSAGGSASRPCARPPGRVRAGRRWLDPAGIGRRLDPEAYIELRGPSELSFLIRDDRRAYYQTLASLHRLYRAGAARIELTHASPPLP